MTLENLRLYTMYLILAVGIMGVFHFSKLPNMRSKSLLGIIFFSFLTEFLGVKIFAWIGVKNYIVYNIYVLVMFNYYILLLNSLLKKTLYKKITNLFFFLFNVVYVINIIYLQNLFEEMLTYCFSLGVIFVLILSFLYLIEIFNSEKVLHFKKSIYFWFVLGMLIFHIPFLPLMIALKLFLSVNPTAVFSIALFMLNLLMYSCFILGFLWSKRKYNY